MVHGGPRRVVDVLAECGKAVPVDLTRCADDLAALTRHTAVAVTPTFPPPGSDARALAAEQLAVARQALATRDRLLAQLPALEASAAEEARRARGVWVLLGLVVVIVLIVLVGQAL